jgi:hypothetical protein|eukprot:Stramenopile-MAST_4_protein_2336
MDARDSQVIKTAKMSKEEIAAFDKITSTLQRTTAHNTIKKFDMKTLAGVSCLTEAFEMFGFHEGDRVRLRDRVNIYNKVCDAMGASLSLLRAEHAHMKAKELNERLQQVKMDYELFYREDERSRGREEMCNLDKALVIEIERHEQRKKKIMEELEHTKARRRRETKEVHAAQKKSLEDKIWRMPKPRFRMSTRMLNMTIGEKHLAKLGEYIPAQQLRNMIKKLEPQEQAQFRREHEARLEKMRNQLDKQQAFDNNKLREALDRVEWNAKRRSDELERNVKQRLENNARDAHHAHTLQMHQKPQKTLKPTIEKRENYASTSSYFRGEQMLSRLVGKKQHAIPGVCSLHDFKKEPIGTINIYHPT